MAFEKVNLYDQISGNKWRSLALVLAFMLIVLFLGGLFGALTGFGVAGLAIAGIISLVMALASYYYSDQVALSLSGAQPADERNYSYLHNTVEGLALAAGIPKPKVYIIDDPALNAFATGRDPQHSSIAVTTGLLKTMNRAELEGVLAHELSHVKNYDIRFSTMVVVLVGVVAMLSSWLINFSLWGGDRDERAPPWLFIVGLLAAILAPLIAQLIQLAVSRKREFLADASGAMLSRNPEGLASALRKIGKQTGELQSANASTAHLFFADPFKQGGKLSSLFSTHPPIAERIAALESAGG